VTAGLVPGQPIAQYTKQWWFTDEEYNASNSREIWEQRTKEAEEYAAALRDPRSLNWVRMEWIWF
jgi:hypothetical protein